LEVGRGTNKLLAVKKKKACYEMLRRASKSAGSCQHGNEPAGSIKGEEFPD